MRRRIVAALPSLVVLATVLAMRLIEPAAFQRAELAAFFLEDLLLLLEKSGKRPWRSRSQQSPSRTSASLKSRQTCCTICSFC